jgi:hypothetical protein
LKKWNRNSIKNKERELKSGAVREGGRNLKKNRVIEFEIALAPMRYIFFPSIFILP